MFNGRLKLCLNKDGVHVEADDISNQEGMAIFHVKWISRKSRQKYEKINS